MSLRLLLREHPQRALGILTDSHALIFRHSLSSISADYSSNNETGLRSKCMVEFTALDDVDLTDYHVLRASGVHGTLGLININADVFLCVISGAVRVATGMYPLLSRKLAFPMPDHFSGRNIKSGRKSRSILLGIVYLFSYLPRRRDAESKI